MGGSFLHMHTKQWKWANWLLRVGISGTFIGHGLYALQVKPAWIVLITSLGLNEAFARSAMPVIGMVDLVVAILVIVKPSKPLLVWCAFWCVATALSRITAGQSILELLERFSNIACPLALLYINNATEKMKSAP